MTLLSSYLENLKDVKVLITGDIMLDRFIYGKVERISPEAPVPVFKFEKERQVLGGAGNVAANLKSLGCRANYIGIIGNDENGKKIASLLNKTGVHSHLLRLNDYPTIVKSRMVAGNHHLLRVDQEEKLPVVTELLPKFRRILRQAVKNVDIVVVSDYNKGLLTPVTTQIIVEICDHFGKKIIIDPKGNDYSKYAGATLVKPNLKEFSEVTGMQYNPASKEFYQQVKQGAELLFDKYQVKNLIITLSEFGMIHVSKENPEDILHVPTEAKEVFDVSGAGDTALAMLGACLGRNVPVKEAMKLANIASGIAVGKLGTAAVFWEEIKTSLSLRESSNDGWEQKRKIISLKQAENIVKNLKEQKKRIVFTNGCFDCCHLGHLNSFMQARKLGDILIVALNSDSSIKRFKGKNRPIQDEKSRALLLASLEFVDYVIVFDEDSPLHIVEALHPDIVAKEGYTLDKWPEGQLAVSYGGKAAVLKRLEGYSTSGLVEKMKG